MVKKKKNEILVDNNMQEFSLRGLTALEQKFWWALVSLIYDKGTEKLTFTRNQIEALSGTKDTRLTDKEFRQQMSSMGNKIVSLHTHLYDGEGGLLIFAVFPVFFVKDDKIEIQVSEYFAPWFNNITKNFSIFDLAFVGSFKSGYTIELYRYLMRWKNAHANSKYPGFWSVKWDKFKKLMNIPDAYAPSDIKRKILVPAKKEFLTPNSLGKIPMSYMNIKLVPVTGYKKKIDRIEFTFIANTVTDTMLKLTTDKPEFNTNKFFKLLDDVNLYDLNVNYHNYFTSRITAKNDIKKLYNEFVSLNKPEWNNITFLVVLLTAINKDKPIADWAFQDIHSGITSHRIVPWFDTPQALYEKLSNEEKKTFDDFKNDGIILDDTNKDNH